MRYGSPKRRDQLVLLERGALRSGLTVEDAADILWTLCSLNVDDALVGSRGWSAARYEAWLTEILTRELLAS